MKRSFCLNFITFANRKLIILSICLSCFIFLNFKKYSTNKDQAINHNTGNTNTSNITGKFEVSVIANCINNNFENINNSAMKDTDNMKGITNKNVDRNKQIRENIEKILGVKKNISITFLKTA